ncbi:centrosomal protein of 290 kDa-like protein [Dinothrombium tinctorium]|uniref:Centrosomal protein of 290 kDa-like protein n=1 Tax=Dinothrombium tinctorium TaxID=1965070 RepID=A0A3S3PUV4_9ACAR|nr:centrosomal protein of 290 kDa-like protein [Dinothrombium tinctorium]RWS16795.1 centrosomal protein of 290 kDa-like protein [Dinothrombium tinctorium]RWS16799.1 centrosomal protein of 290 kDa-like protein [Dinothrombium tinctorium]
MQVKALQADVAIEELEEMAKKQDKNEIETLRKEVEIYKQHLSSSEEKNALEKLKEYNEKMDELNKQLETKNNDLSKAKRRVSDLERKLEVSDKEIEFLKEEIDSLKDEIESQRQGINEHLSESQDPFDKLREKNKQIQLLLDETNAMEAANAELAKQVKSLREQLKSESAKSKSNENEAQSMRQQLTEIQAINEMLVKEKEFLLKETQHLRDLLDNYEREDDIIASKFSEKVDKLLLVLNSKDEQIASLKAKIAQLHLKANSSAGVVGGGGGTEPNRDALLKEIDAKNAEIDSLKKRLHAESELVKSDANIGVELKQVQKERNDLRETLAKLEEELRVKDEELLALRKRNLMYERGEYGLYEALQEVKQLKRELNARDQNIEELVKQLNELNLELNDTQDELDYIRESAQHNFLEPSVDSKNRRNLNDKLKILQLQKAIVKLEDEKISATEELRQLKSHLTGNGKSKNASLLQHLEQLKDENKQLELGMKEILMGIRESDAKSDVVIECPSLERLCQLLESRSLSSKLTNVIALKAELDLLRGHNQQLRMELKRIRAEHLKLIKIYTNDVLNESPSEEIVIKPVDSEKLRDVSEKDSSSDVSSAEMSKQIESREEEATVSEQESDSSRAEEIKPQPLPRRRLSKQLEDKQMQTELENVEKSSTKREQQKEQSEISIQTESPTLTDRKCSRCQRISPDFYTLLNHINKLEQTVIASEDKFIQQIDFLQEENDKLKETLKNREFETISDKYDEIKTPSEEDFQLNNNFESTEEQSANDNSTAETSTEVIAETSSDPPKSAALILETIINCLKTRIDHKDNALKQYENLLQQTQENFEQKMAKMIEDQRQMSEKELRPFDFSEIIDNSELRTALEKCVQELESCKNEYKRNIERLQSERSDEKLRMKQLEEENDKLRLKSSINKYVQLRKQIEKLENECNEKQKTIEKLQKSLRDERTMRVAIRASSSSAPRPTRSEWSENEVANLQQKLNEANSELSKCKQTIKELEIKRWDLEKKLSETSESFRLKLKEKCEEILKLECDLKKLKKLFAKFEKEKSVTAIDDHHQKQQVEADNRLVYEISKLENEKLELEAKIDEYERELAELKANESELRILLSECLRREKLSTISEDNRVNSDEQLTKLLQENAQLKVELRMTEYELRRKNSCQF